MTTNSNKTTQCWTVTAEAAGSGLRRPRHRPRFGAHRPPLVGDGPSAWGWAAATGVLRGSYFFWRLRRRHQRALDCVMLTVYWTMMCVAAFVPREDTVAAGFPIPNVLRGKTGLRTITPCELKNSRVKACSYKRKLRQKQNAHTTRSQHYDPSEPFPARRDPGSWRQQGSFSSGGSTGTSRACNAAIDRVPRFDSFSQSRGLRRSYKFRSDLR